MNLLLWNHWGRQKLRRWELETFHENPKLFNLRCANNLTDTEIKGYGKVFENLGTPHEVVPFTEISENYLFRYSQAENVVLVAREIVSEIETRISNHVELKSPIVHRRKVESVGVRTSSQETHDLSLTYFCKVR